MNNENEQGLSDKQIEEVFMRDWMFRSGSDAELAEQMKQLNSVYNLNNDPLALRKAGFRASRRAFVLGARWGMTHNQES